MHGPYKCVGADDNSQLSSVWYQFRIAFHVMLVDVLQYYHFDKLTVHIYCFF